MYTVTWAAGQLTLSLQVAPATGAAAAAGVGEGVGVGGGQNLFPSFIAFFVLFGLVE